MLLAAVPYYPLHCDSDTGLVCIIAQRRSDRYYSCCNGRYLPSMIPSDKMLKGYTPRWSSS